MQNVYTKDNESGNNKEKISEYATTAIRQGEEKIKTVAADMEKRIKQGEEQLRKVVTNVDKQLHENPWPVVAGVAIGCLFLGFLMGTSKRNG